MNIVSTTKEYFGQKFDEMSPARKFSVIVSLITGTILVLISLLKYKDYSNVLFSLIQKVGGPEKFIGSLGVIFLLVGTLSFS